MLCCGWHVQSSHFRCRWLGAPCPVRRGIIIPALTTAVNDAKRHTCDSSCIISKWGRRQLEMWLDHMDCAAFVHLHAKWGLERIFFSVACKYSCRFQLSSNSPWGDQKTDRGISWLLLFVCTHLAPVCEDKSSKNLQDLIRPYFSSNHVFLLVCVSAFFLFEAFLKCQNAALGFCSSKNKTRTEESKGKTFFTFSSCTPSIFTWCHFQDVEIVQIIIYKLCESWIKNATENSKNYSGWVIFVCCTNWTIILSPHLHQSNLQILLLDASESGKTLASNVWQTQLLLFGLNLKQITIFHPWSVMFLLIKYLVNCFFPLLLWLMVQSVYTISSNQFSNGTQKIKRLTDKRIINPVHHWDLESRAVAVLVKYLLISNLIHYTWQWR